MGVCVYIDGFNFYYRVFKNRARKYQPRPALKWLNLLKLSQLLLPGRTIDWIGYFTAYVKNTPNDPTQSDRQRAYLAALETIDCLEVIPGQFLEVEKSGIPIGAIPPNVIRFKTFEEKGSDVNLACRLVLDAALGAFSEALVITNDGDLRAPIQIVSKRLSLPVTVVSPDLTVNGAIRDVATTSFPLDLRLLKRCLFPEQLTTAAGVPISRPASWR